MQWKLTISMSLFFSFDLIIVLYTVHVSLPSTIANTTLQVFFKNIAN